MVLINLKFLKMMKMKINPMIITIIKKNKIKVKLLMVINN